MFWSNAYTSFLESEVKRLQEENRVLLSAVLERNGHREAAHMLRSDNPEAQAVARKVPVTEMKSKDPIAIRAGWRAVAQSMSDSTKPVQHESSGKALEAKVKELHNEAL